jgi:hypothetical protein
MNQGKYIFAQIVDFLLLRIFDRIVKNHQGNKHIRSFTCWNQMHCMVFGQLTARDSMRDLILSLEAHQSKYYHLGFGRPILAGIKLHTLYDLKSSIPSFLYVSEANVHDVNILDLIPYEAGSYYVVDKAYID